MPKRKPDMSDDPPAPLPTDVVKVQKRTTRWNGWTGERRAAFFRALAATANVTYACAQVGMTTAGAYHRRSIDVSFRRDWREALTEGYARLESGMLERALIAEDRMRGALAAAEDDAEALALLARHPRTSEALLRRHRPEVLAAEAADDEALREATIAKIEGRLAMLRAHLLRERAADGA